jgi:hypothetical protein
MFDITPATTLSEITALDVNESTAGDPLEIMVYYKVGTCVGFASDPSAWTLLGTYTGTSAGQDNPSFIDMAGNGQSWDAGTLYGMYVHLENYPSITGALRYSNATSPPTYANAELSATCYYGMPHPAFGSPFTYRVWNGTIYYEAGPPLPLSVNPKEISAWFGGSVLFKLNGGPDLGGRGYGLFGTVSGTSPGFPLPGGGVLPINWDWYTYLLYFIALAPGNGIAEGFLGTLDVDGYAEATLTLPGHCQLFDDILSNYAWTTNYPWEFQSNDVEVLITGAPPVPPSYAYDDGTSENSLGWTAGGESVWCHSFDSGTSDVLTTVSSTFGSATTTNGPPNGDPCYIYVWDDPNNDGNPIDAALIGTATGVVANTNTNTFNEFVLDAPTAVTAKFFVACHVYQAVGIYAAPMDESTPYGGEAWFIGGAVFDPNDLTTTAMYEMGSIGFPAYWLLRADND